MVAVHSRFKASPSCSAISNVPFPILRQAILFLTKDYQMPKRHKAVAVDPAKANTLDCKHSTGANIVQFKRGSSFEVRPSQRLRPSDGGDPGPAGFDWHELRLG
jgi:hypothetical protein